MTKKILAIAFAAIFSLTAITSLAEDSKEKAVEKLMKAMKVQEGIDRALDDLVSLQLKNFKNRPKLIADIKAFYTKNIGWEAQKTDIISVYKNLFTEKEINDLIAFYETPTGKKMAELEPDIEKRMMDLTRERMKKCMPELQKIIIEALQKTPGQKTK
jgi:hypothetical protein